MTTKLSLKQYVLAMSALTGNAYRANSFKSVFDATKRLARECDKQGFDVDLVVAETMQFKGDNFDDLRIAIDSAMKARDANDAAAPEPVADPEPVEPVAEVTELTELNEFFATPVEPTFEEKKAAGDKRDAIEQLKTSLDSGDEQAIKAATKKVEKLNAATDFEALYPDLVEEVTSGKIAVTRKEKREKAPLARNGEKLPRVGSDSWWVLVMMARVKGGVPYQALLDATGWNVCKATPGKLARKLGVGESFKVERVNFEPHLSCDWPSDAALPSELCATEKKIAEGYYATHRSKLALAAEARAKTRLAKSEKPAKAPAAKSAKKSAKKAA